jgi:hypothetical protein
LASYRDLRVDVEWHGLNELIVLFEGMDKRFTRILKEEFTKYVKLVEQGTKALAPEQEGDLVDSINSEVRMVHHGIMGIVGANTEYALRRHEEPYRPGTHPRYDNGAKFPNYYVNGRGAGTRSKGSWRGYKAGRKYLTNAVKATEKDFQDMLERVLERCIRRGLL